MTEENPNKPRLLKNPPELPPAGGMPDDGTRQLLQTGSGTFTSGLICAALILFVFGGIGPQGPHTNAGWLLLIVAMMCLPFGFLLLLLGLAKWLRNRRLRRDGRSGHSGDGQ